jgi:hypothetical protein
MNQGVKNMAAKKRQGVDNAPGQRLNIKVTTEAYERLLVHAIKARVSPGELVTELIEKNLRQWAVRSNSVRVMSEVSANLDGEASQSEAA